METINRHKNLLVFLVLGLSVFALFPALSGVLLNWDDESYIVNNPLVTSGTLFEIWTTNCMGNYHPLTILSYRVEYLLFGSNPTVFHTTNLLIHLLNTWLLFQILLKYFSNAIIPLLTTALFALHPLHVESVAWISERKDVLYALFYFLSLLSFIHYIKNNSNSYYLISILMFVLSLFSKGQAVTLTGVIILLDIIEGKKLNLKYFITRLPFLCLSVLFGLIALDAQKSAYAINTVDAYSIVEKIVLVMNSVGMYLTKILLPIKLAAVYPYPFTPGSNIPPSVFVYFTLGLLYFISIIVFRKNKYWLLGNLLFIGTILPVLQLVPVGEAIIADRYTYIPAIGLFLLISKGVCWTYTNYNTKVGHVIILAITIGYTLLSFNRSFVWQTKLSFWQDQIEKYPEYGKGYNNLAGHFREIGDKEKAKELFKTAVDKNCKIGLTGWAVMEREFGNFNQAEKLFDLAIQYYPHQSNLYCYKALNHQDKKEYDQAVKLLEIAVTKDPKIGLYYEHLANNYFLLKDFSSAEKMYLEAINNKHHPPLMIYNLGKTYIELNKAQSAIEFINQYISLVEDPQADSYLKLADLYNATGQKELLIKSLSDYIALDSVPKIAAAINRRAEVYFSLKNYPAAIQDFSRCLKINPNDFNILNNRGLAKQFSNDLEGAIQDYSAAVSLNSNYIDGYYNRGRTYLKVRDYQKAINDFSVVLSINPNHIASYKFRGVAYLGVSQKINACIDYKMAKKLNYKGDLTVFKGVCF